MNQKKQHWETQFEAIGTHWRIDAEISEDVAQEIEPLIQATIEDFDAVYSRFRDDSLVSQIQKKAGVYTFPDTAKKMFAVYKHLYDASGGKFTPLVGDFLESIGYDAEYSLKADDTLAVIPVWEDVLSFEAPHTVTVQKPVCLDFGAGGKGYLVDLISAVITATGCQDFSVDGSGDVYVSTSRSTPMRVGLENPYNPQQVIGVCEVMNESICASSVSRRQWNAYHHIIDPDTAHSSQDVVAAWAVADSGLVADSLATALFFSDPEQLQEAFSFEYVILYDGGRVRKSSGYKGELFLQ